METSLRKLVVKIPEQLFKALKIQSVQTDRLMRELVAEALRMYLVSTKGGTTSEPQQPRVLSKKASGVAKPPKK